MTTLEKFAKTLTQIDYELAEAGEQQSIENHILDTVGATIAGASTPDGQHIFSTTRRARKSLSLNEFSRGVLGDVRRWSAVTRLSEIDDIHLSSGTTPGSIIIPTALSLSKHVGNKNPKEEMNVMFHYLLSPLMHSFSDGAKRSLPNHRFRFDGVHRKQNGRSRN